MTTSPLSDIYDEWTRPNFYQRRVRGTAADPTFLWGSSKISKQTFEHPLILHIHNDTFGEPITLATQVSTISGPVGKPTPIGTLQPGECFSIPVQTISGVYATCALESTVTCAIRTSH